MITKDVFLGDNVIILHPELVNLYGCRIGSGSKIASFVEIQRDVTIGSNSKIEAFAFIPTGVTIEDGVFIGPHVCFTNDKYPRAVGKDMQILSSDQWKLYYTTVKKRASIGANCTIVCGITIGKNSIIGAGSVVTKNVPDNVLVYGNPAKIIQGLK